MSRLETGLFWAGYCTYEISEHANVISFMESSLSSVVQNKIYLQTLSRLTVRKFLNLGRKY